MEAVTRVQGRAIPFGAANVDTDVIMPSRWLKTVGRTGLGRGAFEALRRDPDNVFDVNAGAPILIAGENFGCGSSREHAAWALKDLGIRAVIAPSFADIFASNAFKNGIVLVQLPREAVDRLMVEPDDITVDLDTMTVTTPRQDRFAFSLDPFRRHCLMNGLDEIGLTLQQASSIAAYEAAVAPQRPWVGITA